VDMTCGGFLSCEGVQLENLEIVDTAFILMARQPERGCLIRQFAYMRICLLSEACEYRLSCIEGLRISL